ncbi:MAG TPA: hypothetical protein VMK12_32430, partial [Anaeromyxobacteraceae bacterium]|nr:hypothetical protein [Anaeromyxobacteraceae bacterium]
PPRALGEVDSEGASCRHGAGRIEPIALAAVATVSGGADMTSQRDFGEKARQTRASPSSTIGGAANPSHEPLILHASANELRNIS